MKREIDLNRMEFGQPHWMQPSRGKLPSDTREAIREFEVRDIEFEAPEA